MFTKKLTWCFLMIVCSLFCGCATSNNLEIGKTSKHYIECRDAGNPKPVKPEEKILISAKCIGFDPSMPILTKEYDCMKNEVKPESELKCSSKWNVYHVVENGREAWSYPYIAVTTLPCLVFDIITFPVQLWLMGGKK